MATETTDSQRLHIRSAVIDIVLSDPDRTWRGTELADRVDAAVIDTMVALAVLCGEGAIERVASGTYRAPATPADVPAPRG